MIDTLGLLNCRGRFTGHCRMLCDSVASSKTAGYGQRTEGAAFRMAGNYGVARAQGRFSLRDADGRLGLHWQSSFHPSASSSPLLEEERHETAHQTGAQGPNILWRVRPKSPSACVFFTCNPYALALLTPCDP